jgi:hypothetical protein
MSYFYLATPYSKYPGGVEAAYRLACEQTALLLAARIPTFSPIAHTHGVAIHGNLDPLDHSIWMDADYPMMDAAMGLIFLKAESWEQSVGMNIELNRFIDAAKPIFNMTPGEIPYTLKQWRVRVGAP